MRVLIVSSICRIVWGKGKKKGSHRLQTPVFLWRNKGEPFCPLGIGTSTFTLVICTWGEGYADEGIRNMLDGKGS